MNPSPLDPSALMRSFAELEIRVAKLEQQVFEKDKQIASARTLIDSLRGEIAVLREQNIAALEEVDLRGEQMVALRESYERSTSWRVTRPLRWLSELRGGAKPAQVPAPLPAQTVPVEVVNTAGGVEPVDEAVADRHDYSEWVRRFDMLAAHEAPLSASTDGDALPNTVVTVCSIIRPGASQERTVTALEEMRASLLNQQYTHWEWLVVCEPFMAERLRVWNGSDERIRVVEAVVRTDSPWQAWNLAAQTAKGTWLLWVDDQLLLRSHALRVAMEHLQRHPTARLLYADNDFVDEHGLRSQPEFRCDANPDLMLATDYLGRFALFHCEDLLKVGACDTTLPSGHRHDLFLRLTEHWTPGAATLAHLPQIVVHELTDGPKTHSEPESTGSVFFPAWGLDANDPETEHPDHTPALVQAHLNRMGCNSVALPHPRLANACHVRFQLPPSPPRVGIIIPTRDNVGVLSVCLQTLLQQSTYPDIEVVVVDNGSAKPETLAYFEAIEDRRVRVVRDDAPFNFSRLINIGANSVRGDVLCLLNNDLQITQPDWLEEMVGWALQDGVAAVGARLWYGEGQLQHGGIILGIQGIAGHAHKFLKKGEPGYMNRAELHQTMSAVTGACMVVRRNVFDELGGFDEALGVAYNDVDFCLRARKAGYRNVWTPHAEMIHHESISRGFEDSPEKQARFQREAALMRERWGDWLADDPAYNPNLTLEHEDFGLAWPPRKRSA